MKKVLSFVLILALVLSSFSMAFAASGTELTTLSDISGNTNEEAIEVNYDLGIVTGNPDGTFQPEKAVTRAEFAAMITRALAIPDSALAAYSSTSFSDTAGYGWAVPYLAFCNSKGIMLGDGAGRAMPGQTITVNEAVTMVLRAIGYTANSAELTGVWPSNYVTKAQELKLYDDVAKDATGVDKANAAQIIYNALAVQKVAVNSDGETKKLWDEEPTVVGGNTTGGVPTTLLTAGLNCEAHDDVVVGYDFDTNDSLINIAKHIGKFGTIYTNDDDEIVAFISDSDQLVGRFTAVDKFTTTDEEKEYNINVTTVGATIVNGDKGGSNVSIATLTGGIYNMSGEEFVLNVDLSGKTVKEVYSATKWSVTDANQVDSTQIADINDDESLLGSDFILDDNDEIDYTQFHLVGVNSIKDIKEDNVVYVYANSSREIIRIEVGTETAEGVVKNFKDAKSDVASKFAIGANTYKNASEVVNGSTDGGSTVDEGNVSDEVKAVLDARGYVYDFEDLTGADNFAVIEKIDSGITDQAKLMLSDGTEKVFEYDDDADEAGPQAVNTVIGYGLDKSGVITDTNRNYVIVDEMNIGSTKTITTITNGAIFGQSTVTSASAGALSDAKIDSNVVVFTYENVTTTAIGTANWGSYDFGDFDVTTIDKVEINASIKNVMLLFDEDNKGVAKTDKVVAILIPEDMAKGGDKSYAVLNERNKDADDDGEKVWQAVGYRDGARLDALTDSDTTNFFPSFVKPDYSNSASIRVYEVKVDSDGVITDAKLINELDTSKEVHMISAATATAVDKRASVVLSGQRYAIADNAVFYQLTDDDEYKVSSSSLKENDIVQLYETDDDSDGYDIVVFIR